MPLLFTLALASCQPSAPAASHTVTDSAGVRIVESREAAWGQPGRRIAPEPLMRIGRTEGGGDAYLFSRVWEGVLLPDDRIAVSDALAREIRIFDSTTGDHLGSLGGEGGGPGEFRFLGPVFDYPGDSIAGFDGRLLRTTVFSLSDGGARVIPTPVEGNFQTFGVLGDGALLLGVREDELGVQRLQVRRIVQRG